MHPIEAPEAFIVRRALPFALLPSLFLLIWSTPSFGQRSERESGQQKHHFASRIQDDLREDDLEGALAILGHAVDSSATATEEEYFKTQLSAAAGGIYRKLAQLTSFEQYDLLYPWTMPSDGRQSIRLLTTLVPRNTPPKDFARLLRERPGDTSFPIAEINGISGLFCSGWILVDAAKETGRLATLTAELKDLLQDEVANADVLLLLAQLRSDRTDLSGITENIQTLFPRDSQTKDERNGPHSLNWSKVALAAAALRHSKLSDFSEEVFGKLADQSYGSPAPIIRPFLRTAHAIAVQRNRGQSNPQSLHENRLKYWIPCSGMTASRSQRGAVDAMWLAHEEHILHLAGSANDVLLFRYPLMGKFEFTCETQEGGRIGTDGGLVYGGLQFEAIGRGDKLTVWDADCFHSAQRPCPYVRTNEWPTFNRVSIRSHEEGAQFLANLHPVWRDNEAADGSPWLGLRSFGVNRPIFRNLKITGDPVIPREVHLCKGGQLRGWQSGYFGERQPAFSGATEDTSSDFSADWQLDNGVLSASRENNTESSNQQSLLRYQRPLLNGETIQYEFYYEQESFAVHPSLGRLAFLVEPNGIRVHWITDGSNDWTGLPADNKLLEPLNRKGPAEFPLQEDDWNHLALSRSGDTIKISLNETPVYERSIDFESDHCFGFFRNPAQEAVKIRNVVMTGDWPESLPEEFLENPATVRGDLGQKTEPHTLNDIVGDRFLAENVWQVRHQAASLEPNGRYEFLVDWILPGDQHPTLRVSGAFTPVDPAPPVLEMDTRPNGEEPPVGDPLLGHGGTIVSPVFDLLDLAIRLGRLEELRGRLERLSFPARSFQQRALLAILLMVDLERADNKAAAKSFEELRKLLKKAESTNLAEIWPETLVVSRGVQREQKSPEVMELLSILYSLQKQQALLNDSPVWQHHISSLFGQRTVSTASLPASPISSQLKDWIPLSRTTAWTRGKGLPSRQWCWDGKQIQHVRGGHSDFLLFRSPLRGQFAFEGDIGSHLTTQFYTAGEYFGPRWKGDKYEYGTFREGSELREIDPPIGDFGPWIRFRVEYREGVRTVFLNGHPVSEKKLALKHDPWICFRTWGENFARIRDVHITGTPEIPELVEMSASPELTGWLPYHMDGIAFEGAAWNYLGDSESTGQIYGKRNPELAGTHHESLLRYHRPLTGNCSVEYQFFYEPGQAVVHPALDRLAFMLDPKGVQVHWITDARYDPTSIDPNNLHGEPENRRGPDELSFRPGAWNQMKVELVNGTARLTLNGELIYERQLDPGNQRTFGLFHYSDRTESLVRNVVMKGDWPRDLPSTDIQRLADQRVVQLDAEAEQLDSRFTHDFAQDGLPEEYFEEINTDNEGTVHHRPDGVLVHRPGLNNWTRTGIRLRFGVEGDFDLQARFEQYQPQTEGTSQALLFVQLDDEYQHFCRMMRVFDPKNDHRVDASLSLLHPDGSRSYNGSPTAFGASSGRLRIARRGDQVHFLVAENDSPCFRLLRTEQLSDQPSIQNGIDLRSYCNGNGGTKILWKNITICAEALKYLSPQKPSPERALFTMEPDGSNLQLLTKPLDGYTHLGSPEFSADGSQIAFDMSTGPVSTSHIFVMDADGRNLTDLGPGCMPSFSRDGSRIVQSQSGTGIVIMDSDGSNRRVIDARGWGVQWSPDGKYIAYGKSGNIILMDIETKEKRELLIGENADRYRYIYWNLGWSHDSRSIAFKARPRASGKYEVAAVNIDAPDEFQVLYSSSSQIHADFFWSPDNRRVLFAMKPTAPEETQLVAVASDGQEELHPLLDEPPDVRMLGGAWSPDGKTIVFSGERDPQPVLWNFESSKSVNDATHNPD